MPTIYQLPSATAVANTDLLPLSQSGQTRSVTVGALLSGTQSLIALPQDTLAGRTSPGAGGIEAITLGTGIALQSGALVATAQDHTSLQQAPVLQATDEIIINSASVPKRVGASSVRNLFSAGAGVTIDQSGVISVTSGSNGVGPQGPAGPAGAAGQGLTFRGAWQATTAYNAYDVVVYSGQSYFVQTSFTSGAGFDASKLVLMAAQGAAGPTGPQGPQGAQGAAGPITPATPTALGAVKPGAGLVVSSDGTLSIGSVNLSAIAQGGAAAGQVLGWTGTGWGPTQGSAAGVGSFNGRAGTVTLALGDVTAVLGTGATARTNLNLAAVAASGAYSDLTGTPALPSAATAAPAANGVANAGTAATFARGDHVHPSDTTKLTAANNLSDLANAATARTNLGLGGAATLNVGTAAGTVAAGNDTRITGALQAAAIPAAAGALLGGSATAGATVAVSVGSGLTLTNGVLSAPGGGSGSTTLQPATTTTLGGVKPDGTSVSTTSDGTLSVVGVSASALPDVSTAGGPALSDITVVTRGTSDYKAALSSSLALFRKTPAGSRTVTLSTSATTVTLSSSDHDKIVVAGGSGAGTLSADGTVTDGFRCQVINHSGAALAFSGISGLGGATSLANGASTWVTLSNATLEASTSGAAAAGSNGQLQINSSGTLGAITVGTGLTISGGVLTANTPAYFTFGVAGVVNSLPGGAGAVVYRYVFVRPCTLATNVASPYAAQGQSGTPPSANATFTLSKLSGGTTTAIGGIAMAPTGAVSSSTTQVTFAAGDELVVAAPSPTDSALADVSITFTGAWG